MTPRPVVRHVRVAFPIVRGGEAPLSLAEAGRSRGVRAAFGDGRERVLHLCVLLQLVQALPRRRQTPLRCRARLAEMRVALEHGARVDGRHRLVALHAATAASASRSRRSHAGQRDRERRRSLARLATCADELRDLGLEAARGASSPRGRSCREPAASSCIARERVRGPVDAVVGAAPRAAPAMSCRAVPSSCAASVERLVAHALLEGVGAGDLAQLCDGARRAHWSASCLRLRERLVGLLLLRREVGDDVERRAAPPTQWRKHEQPVVARGHGTRAWPPGLLVLHERDQRALAGRLPSARRRRAGCGLTFSRRSPAVGGDALRQEVAQHVDRAADVRPRARPRVEADRLGARARSTVVPASPSSVVQRSSDRRRDRRPRRRGRCRSRATEVVLRRAWIAVRPRSRSGPRRPGQARHGPRRPSSSGRGCARRSRLPGRRSSARLEGRARSVSLRRSPSASRQRRRGRPASHAPRPAAGGRAHRLAPRRGHERARRRRSSRPGARPSTSPRESGVTPGRSARPRSGRCPRWRRARPRRSPRLARSAVHRSGCLAAVSTASSYVIRTRARRPRPWLRAGSHAAGLPPLVTLRRSSTPSSRPAVHGTSSSSKSPFCDEARRAGRPVARALASSRCVRHQPPTPAADEEQQDRERGRRREPRARERSISPIMPQPSSSSKWASSTSTSFIEGSLKTKRALPMRTRGAVREQGLGDGLARSPACRSSSPGRGSCSRSGPGRSRRGGPRPCDRRA